MVNYICRALAASDLPLEDLNLTTIHAVEPAAAPSGSYFALTFTDCGDRSMEFEAPVAELERALKESGGVGRLEVQIPGDSAVHHAIVRSVREDEGRRRLLVREIKNSDVVRIAVPVRATVLPTEAQVGRAQVVQRMRHITIRGPISRIPVRIEADLSVLGVGEALRARDLKLPDEAELVTPGELEVFFVRARADSAERRF